MLPVKERTKGLEKVATTDHTQQLPPGTTIGMAIGAEIAPADPAPIGTVRVRAEMGGGVDLAAAPSRRHDARWRSCGGLRARGGGVLTGVAGRLCGEARKGFGLTAPRAPWWRGLRWWRLRNGTVAWPRPLEQEAQPHQGDQHQLGKKEMGDHEVVASFANFPNIL